MRTMRTSPTAVLVALTLLSFSTIAVGQEGASQPAKEPLPSSEPAKEVPGIQSGSTVELEYTLKDGTGDIISSNRVQEPLRYIHGQHEIPPGLEQALAGLRFQVISFDAPGVGQSTGYTRPRRMSGVARTASS